MKRSLVLLGVVALFAAGCGGSSNSSSPPTTTSGGGKPGSGKKIGLVTDIGGLNDRGFNHLSYVGLQRAQQELGVQTQVFQAKSTQDYVPNLSTFARQGYDLTIGVGFTEATAIDTAATNFPKSNFAIVDVDQTTEPHKPTNLLGLLFKEQETGYLVGYLTMIRCGELALVSQILGHAEHLEHEIMYQLFAGALSREVRADPFGVCVYNRHDSGTDGLRFFKERLGFEEAAVEWAP